MLNLIRKSMKNLLGRRETQTVAARLSVGVEPLEDRTLMAAPKVISAIADNRGRVYLTFDSTLTSSTVTTSSFLLYTAGADGKLRNSDDVKRSVSLSYSSTRKTVTMTASLKANTAYRVKVDATKVKGSTGQFLDGEYHGATSPSGNGAAGGSFEFITKAASAASTTARVTTTDGIMDIKLYKSDTRVAATVNNFIRYVDARLYDSTIFHRKSTVADSGVQVIQGGGYQLTSANTLAEAGIFGNIALQAVLSNTRGTICMARSNDPNSANSQFYINYQSNTNLDNSYAVFGKVSGTSSFATMDKIAGRSTVNASSDTDIATSISSALGTLPVQSTSAFNSRGSLDPSADCIRITRAAMLMTVARAT